MSLLGAWCLVLLVSFANGQVEDDSCTGDSCGASDSSALLQGRLNMVDAMEPTTEEAAQAQGDDDDDNDRSESGDSDADCSTFTSGSTCLSNGCSWSQAFEGEKKEDGSAVSGYICADDEEVEEEVHDKLMNGTGSLIQMLEDDSEITRRGKEERWCSRRRRGRGWSCPYCRRRRAPPPAPAKIEANGCTTGFAPWSNGKCPGSGKCCKAGWKSNCGQGCAQQRCASTGGSWIPLNYATNPYTCEMPKPPSKPSEYCDEPKADNAGFDCLCAAGTGFCGLAHTWTGPLAAAKTKCDGNAECKYLHDWKADGNNWRACRKITSPGDGKAAIKKKSISGKCAPPAAATPPAPTPGKDLFNSIDGDKNQGISRSELQKAINDGKVIPGAAAPTVKPPVTPPAAPKAPSSGILTQSQKDAIVKKHNALRAGLGASDMMKMTWDDALANAAQQYVSGLSLLAEQSNQSSQKCPRGHSQNRPRGVGENMAWKWSSGFQLTGHTDFTPSIQSWYDEIKDAGPYKTGGTFTGFGQCSGVCGHYTQVVWAAANKIGCGAAYCPHSTGMGGYELVCQYGTSVSGRHGGNMGGETVFTKGTACSRCPNNFGTCSSNLCA